MNENKINSKIDLYITAMIGYFFLICLSFTYLELGDDITNYIMLTVVMVVALISYYLSRPLALIVSMVTIFSFCTYQFYFTFKNGTNLKIDTLYWVVVIPVTSILVSIISETIIKFQSRVKELEKHNNELIMVDEDTGIKNISGFMNEMPIYMNLHRRYDIPISLILVRIKHSDKLKRIIGHEHFTDVLKKCSDTLIDVLRFEDRKYIVNRNTFAYIIISDKNGTEIVKERIREAVNEMAVGKEELYRDLNIEINIGSYTLTEDIKDSMEFLNLAEKELNYDV